MPIVAKLDELGKPAWIALMVLGFIVLLAARPRDPRLHHMEWTHGMLETVASMSRWQPRWRHARAWRGARHLVAAAAPSSGNRAFDEYRTETLRRLEDEQREFHDFLDRLRMAKDKSEFDQFMAERRNRPTRRNPAAAGLSHAFCDGLPPCPTRPARFARRSRAAFAVCGPAREPIADRLVTRH